MVGRTRWLDGGRLEEERNEGSSDVARCRSNEKFGHGCNRVPQTEWDGRLRTSSKCAKIDCPSNGCHTIKINTSYRSNSPMVPYIPE